MILTESDRDLVEQVVTALRSVTGSERVALHEPWFKGNELKYLEECIRSTFVSSVGEFVDRFESDLAIFTGAKHVVVTVNGTAALHVALILAEVQRNDEVLVPALTFAATANAVMYCGAIPHFVDADPSTLGMSPQSLRQHLEEISEQRGSVCVNRRTGRVIRALLPMHTFGHPVDMESLLSIASDFNIAVVEDAAESLGSYYRGKHTGTFGLMGVLSFNGNKILTTGGGGAILTNDDYLAARAKHMTTTSKVPHPWEYRHDEVGFNYRMPNLNAALGCAQLELLPELLSMKRELYAFYQRVFEKIREVGLFREPDDCKSNYWLQAIILRNGLENLRDEILSSTNKAGVMTRPVWKLMYKMSHFSDCPRMKCSVAEHLEKSLINIPSSPQLLK